MAEAVLRIMLPDSTPTGEAVGQKKEEMEKKKKMKMMKEEEKVGKRK